jgi:hypothetical protein
MGADRGAKMAEIRRDTADTKEYAKALNETMNWGIVKTEYSRLYRAISRWKGHLILTAEAASIKGERDEELLRLYSRVGFRPTGDKRLSHATHSIFFMEDAKRGYRFTSCKDRTRTMAEHQDIESLNDGGFAMTYLCELGGWKMRKGGG